MNSNGNQYTTIITPQRGLMRASFLEIWRYKELIYLFARRDFVSQYKQTILGPIWYIIQPLITTLVFTVVFGKIARIPTDGLPQILFYMSGIIIWNYFSGCVTKTSDTFSANSGLFGKVYFPRLTVPISILITNILALLIQLCLFAALIIYFYLKGTHIILSGWIVLMPVIIAFVAIFGLGVGLLVTSITTKYWDIKFMIGFFISLWMWASPIAYPTSQVPSNWKFLYTLNPLATAIESFRFIVLGIGAVELWQVMVSVAITIAVFLIGVFLFLRAESTFIDTI